MKNKILVWTITSVLVLGLAAGSYFWFWAPQTIVLSGGTKLTLVAVTYGKHHVFKRKDKRGRTTKGSINTTNDTLCLWVEQQHKPNNWPNYQMLVYDGAEKACVANYMMSYANPPGRANGEVMGLVFEAFPRRHWWIYARVLEWNMRNGRQDPAKGRFVIRNPVHSRTFSRWTPSTLPISQSADDLDVTLTRFQIGVNFDAKTKPTTDPKDKAVFTAFRIQQSGNVLTNWQPVQIETTDATGNHCFTRGTRTGHENDEQTMTYQWGLWPDEPAWKLRVEMSRQSGFTPDEIWTVHSVPLQPGDLNDVFRQDKRPDVFDSTTIGDVRVEIYPVMHLDKNQRQMWGGMDGLLSVHLDPPLDGMRLTILKMTDDHDRPLEYYNWNWGGGDYRFAVKNARDTTTVNVTLALHRSRYFEFMVKPAK